MARLFFIVFWLLFNGLMLAEDNILDKIEKVGGGTMGSYFQFNNEMIVLLDNTKFNYDVMKIIYYEKNEIKTKTIKNLETFLFHKKDNYLYLYNFNKLFYYECYRTCLNMKTIKIDVNINEMNSNDKGGLILNSKEKIYVKSNTSDWVIIEAVTNCKWSTFDDDTIYFMKNKNLLQFSIQTNTSTIFASNVNHYSLYKDLMLIEHINGTRYIFRYGIMQKLVFPTLMNLEYVEMIVADSEEIIVLGHDHKNSYLLRSSLDLKFVRLKTFDYIIGTYKYSCFYMLTNPKIPGLILANLEYNGQTMISYNYGFTWKNLKIIDKNNTLNHSFIKLIMKCEKHQEFESFNENYPWILLSIGHDDFENYCLYISFDYGSSWRCIFKSYVRYMMANNGQDIYVFKNDHLYKTTTYGQKWSKYSFKNSKSFYNGRIFKDNSSNNELLLIYEFVSKRETYYYHDITAANQKKCEKDDLETWHPTQDTTKESHHCVKGAGVKFMRRKLLARCIFDPNMELETITYHPCPCTKEDYGCAFGYYPDNGQCLKDPFVNSVDLQYCNSENLIETKNGYLLMDNIRCEISDDEHVTSTEKCSEHSPVYFIVHKEYRLDIIHLISSNDQDIKYTIKNIFVSNLTEINLLPLSATISFKDHCLYGATSKYFFYKCPYYGTNSVPGYTTLQRKIIDMNYDHASSNLLMSTENSFILISEKGFMKTIYEHNHDIRHFNIFIGYLIFHTSREIYKLSFSDFSVKLYISVEHDINDFVFVNENSLYFIDNGNVYEYKDNSTKFLFYSKNAHSIWFHNGIIFISSDSDIKLYNIKTKAFHTIDVASNKLDFENTIGLDKSFLCEHKCSYLCIMTDEKNHRCLCPDGYSMISDKCVFNSQKVNCTSEQFQCSDGYCIAANKKCNDFYDCSDKSDETDCFEDGCTADEFLCEDGKKCINFEQYCDGKNDCEDKSDESICEEGLECEEGEFSCSNSVCIDKLNVCDGNDDCGDKSDEKNCHQKLNCTINQYVCHDKSCISKTAVCDGKFDCSKNEDEENCNDKIPITHEVESCTGLYCDSRCISEEQLCDGIRQCSDGIDERMCKKFQCKNSCGDKCIRDDDLCDGFNDCSDGSDEIKCLKYNVPLITNCKPPYSSKCNDICYPIHLICHQTIVCPEFQQELCQLDNTLLLPTTTSSHEIVVHFNPNMNFISTTITLYNIDNNQIQEKATDSMNIIFQSQPLNDYILAILRNGVIIHTSFIKTPPATIAKPTIQSFDNNYIVISNETSKIIPYYIVSLVSFTSSYNFTSTSNYIDLEHEQYEYLQIKSCYNHDYGSICSETLTVHKNELNKSEIMQNNLIKTIVITIIGILLISMAICAIYQHKKRLFHNNVADTISFSKLVSTYDDEDDDRSLETRSNHGDDVALLS